MFFLIKPTIDHLHVPSLEWHASVFVWLQLHRHWQLGPYVLTGQDPSSQFFPVQPGGHAHEPFTGLQMPSFLHVQENVQFVPQDVAGHSLWHWNWQLVILYLNCSYLAANHNVGLLILLDSLVYKCISQWYDHIGRHYSTHKFLYIEARIFHFDKDLHTRRPKHS